MVLIEQDNNLNVELYPHTILQSLIINHVYDQFCMGPSKLP